MDLQVKSYVESKHTTDLCKNAPSLQHIIAQRNKLEEEENF